ncbi:MAG: phosphoribosylformylglycinamidine cyclo-ligase, partial [Pseudomonadota bacterium]
MGRTTYQDAGVDINRGDALVERIKKRVKATYGPRVLDGVGGFASLFKMDENRYLAAGTDGVGTKLKIAQDLGIHNTIGIDLVAMCVNDVICTGATPLFFLDYFATGKLDVEVADQVIAGIVDGCLQAGCALVGGETAEMPGMYPDGEYDLAGFAVGEVDKSHLLDGNKICDGDVLIGIASSGAHSNGYSLVRRLIPVSERELLKEALTPTRIYVSLLKKIIQKNRSWIKGLAHITGSGFLNIPRINEKFDYHIPAPPPKNEIPRIYSTLWERSGLTAKEIYCTFNMGVG